MGPDPFPIFALAPTKSGRLSYQGWAGGTGAPHPFSAPLDGAVRPADAMVSRTAGRPRRAEALRDLSQAQTLVD